MPNTLLSPNQVAKEVLELIERETAGMTIEERIGYWYDLQTWFGHFPATAEQRDAYIREAMRKKGGC